MYLHRFFLFLYSPAISFVIGELPKSSDRTQPCQLSATTTDLSFPQIPESGQSFRTIRTSKENYIFVDKTNYIKELIDNDEIMKDSKIYFLARPKTFGKTFFLSMVHEFLYGSKELFKNTNIYSRGNTIEGNGSWTQNPVIHIDFSEFPISTVRGFKAAIKQRLREIANRYSVGIDNVDDSIISWLIRNLKSKFNSKVSIIIDEFDFPLVLASNKRIKRNLMQILLYFYAEIKAAAVIRSEIWLVLILGVSKLNIVYEAMNNMITDITFEEKFSSMIGFSTDEVEKNFKPYLDKLAKEKLLDISDSIQKLDNLYGGYHFTTEKGAAVLNSGSVCSCLRQLKIIDFWTKTLNIHDITEQMKDEGKGIDYFKFRCIKEELLEETFYGLNDNEIPLYIQMLNNGYLTIKLYRSKIDEVCLSYPNVGVQNHIERALPPNLRSNKNSTSYGLPLRELMLEALKDRDIQLFVELMIEGALPEVSPSLKYTMPRDKEEFVATSEIFKALKILKFACEEGRKLYNTENGDDCADLDIIIFSSEKSMPHYVIENTVSGNPQDAVFQLFGYVVKTHVAFERVFDGHPETNIINLFGVTIKKHKHRQRTISDWILVPYSTKDKKIRISEAKASQDEVLSSLTKRLEDQPYYEQNKHYFILD